jgi:hypothetical protein
MTRKERNELKPDEDTLNHIENIEEEIAVSKNESKYFSRHCQELDISVKE